jgi:hypothetical protein
MSSAGVATALGSYPDHGLASQEYNPCKPSMSDGEFEARTNLVYTYSGSVAGASQTADAAAADARVLPAGMTWETMIDTTDKGDKGKRKRR